MSYSAESFWKHITLFLVEHKLIVGILALLLVGAGLSYAPFSWNTGFLPHDPVPVDALPDISENQQIVFTKWPGRSPKDVEDQITYPLTSALLGLPGVRSIRSSSVMGFSSIYVIFEDEIEFYWSRSRILEKLASLPPNTLPNNVRPSLGPDATALGQVYWYTIEARDEQGHVVPGAFDLHELRSLQDWNVRFALQSVPGVSEVASVGGFVREYQVDVDPQALLAHEVSIAQVASAVRGANLDVGARTIEINRAEYLVRGIGFIEGREDLEQVVIASREHTPIRVRDVARVSLGPANRRGALDKEGAPTVGGVVVVRYGDNALTTIDRVRKKIEQISPGLPSRTLQNGQKAQVEIVPFYDRTELIRETLDTLSDALLQQLLITILVVLLIMRQLRASLLVSVLLPMGVLATFVLMKSWRIDANVMALSGIAIAIGTMVDMGIVFTENISKHLESGSDSERRAELIAKGAAEVAPAVMTAVLTTVIGFLPIFALSSAEGKLFRPLAYTKTFAMLGAFILAVLILPTLADLLLPKKSLKPSKTRLKWHYLLLHNATFGWLLLGLGGLLSAYSLPWMGVAVLFLGALELSQPRLPAAIRDKLPLFSLILCCVSVTWLLASYWKPLGASAYLFSNLLFVVASVAMVMLGFWGFARIYRPLLAWSLKHKRAFLSTNLALVLLGLLSWQGLSGLFSWMPKTWQKSTPISGLMSVWPGLKSDFMPPFDEGAFLYMPTTTPHASMGQALEMLKNVDAAIAGIPEVKNVVGKLGRAESALDPAPISMFENVIHYKNEFKRIKSGDIGHYRYESSSNEFARDNKGHLIPDEGGRPFRQWRAHIRNPDDIWNEITQAARHPGLTGSPKLMPIKTRIVMLQSGMRSAVGLKIQGADLGMLEEFALNVEGLFKKIPEIAPDTVLADRIVGKPYLEIAIDRQAIARHGFSITDVQDVIQIAIGGRALSWTVEGRERYPVRVRYMREERDSIEAIGRVLVSMKNGTQIPLEQLADIRYVKGPQMIRSEDTFLTAYVTFDPKEGIGEVQSVHAAEKTLDAAIANGELVVPPGVSYHFAGTYENQVRSAKRLSILVPVALAIIFLLLYLQFQRSSTALIVFSGVVLAASGAFVLLWFYSKDSFMNFDLFGLGMRELFNIGDTRLTVAVWVGFLALFGIATDNGVIVATYLKQRIGKASKLDLDSLHSEVIQAGERRLRPCLMTTATTLLALLPIITSTGRGADLMIPMALPTVGGIMMGLLTLITVPVLYSWIQERKLYGSPDVP